MFLNIDTDPPQGNGGLLDVVIDMLFQQWLCLLTQTASTKSQNK